MHLHHCCSLQTNLRCCFQRDHWQKIAQYRLQLMLFRKTQILQSKFVICYKGACISFDFRLWLHIVLLANLQVQGVLLPDILGHQAVDFVPQQEGIVDIPACLPSICTYTSRSNAVLNFTTDLIVRVSLWKDCAARRSL